MVNNKLKIISAFYDNLDVTNIVNNRIENDKLNILVNNDLFTDPSIGKQKILTIKYVYDNIEYINVIREHQRLIVPEINESNINILVLTSCNRTKQVLLALTINSFVIKDRFSVVIADNSTLNLNFEEAYKMHVSDDPYNLINSNNYSNDISIFAQNLSYLKNIDQFKLVHVEPRLDKQRGEASLITNGMAQASIIGKDEFFTKSFALKLTGVCILKNDILSKLKNILVDKDVLLYNRTHYSDQKSTRVFAGKPKIISNILINEGYDGWIFPYHFLEVKFEGILKKHIPDRIEYANDESEIILDEGVAMTALNMRNLISDSIEKLNIPKDIPIIKEFLEGGVW